MKHLLHFLFFLAITFNSIGQNYNHKNWWYFSYAKGIGINFPGGNSPVAVTNGQMKTTEACSAASDKQGNLLFYTNGIEIWDSSHTLMPTSHGVMYGQTPASLNTNHQGAVIVCDPYNMNEYYVLTIAGNNSSVDSLFYFKVDMSLPGNGTTLSPLGDIVQGSKRFIASQRKDFLTAIRHENKKDWWIVTAPVTGSIIEVFLLNSSGISPTPVYAGNGGSGALGLGNYGMLRSSPDGKKLLAASYLKSGNTYIFDFNTSTGSISSGINLGMANNMNNTGAEFSPSGKILYLGQWGYNGSFATFAQIRQLDLTLPSTSIVSSSIVIDTVDRLIGSGMSGSTPLQLGPDGKIYFSGDFDISVVPPIGYLGVINSPDSIGAVNCNYNNKKISFTGFSNWQDLISLPQFFEPLYTNDFSNTSGCNNNFSFEADTTNGYNCFKWIFGDAATGNNDTSYLQNPSHQFSSAGTYSVTLISSLGCNCESDTIIKVINVTAGSIDTTVQVSGVTLTAQQAGATYQWLKCEGAILTVLPGDTSQSYTPSTNGSYAVIINVNGCADTSVCVNINSVGVFDDPAIKSSISIYPNPNKGIFTINNQSAISKVAEIYNLLGDVIYSNIITPGTHQIHLNNLSVGVYYIRLYSSEGNAYQQKLIIE